MQGRKPPSKPLGQDDDVVDLPSSKGRVPDPPQTLDGRARKLWTSVVSELVARNTYDGDCQDAVEMYCVLRARFIEAEEHIKKHGPLIKGRLNPSVRISHEACRLMHKYAIELGLTPASRKRVVKVRGGLAAPAAKYLKQGG